MFANKIKMLTLWPVATVFAIGALCLLLASGWLFDGQIDHADSGPATDSYAKGATGAAGDFMDRAGRHSISSSGQAFLSDPWAGSPDTFTDKNNRIAKSEQGALAAGSKRPVHARSMTNTRERAKAGTDLSRKDLSYQAQPAVSFAADGAVEIAVPVDHAGGGSRAATVPVALELAANPQGLPPQVQDAIYDMALDFIEQVGLGAAADTANSAGYLKAWEAAARNSDYQFRMRYGKVAFVQMNLLMAQEAAANGY